MRNRMALVSLLAVAALLLAACGDDGSESIAQTGTDEHNEDTDHDEGESDHDEEFAFGMPADAADADRVGAVVMSDEFLFDPSTVEIAAGEVVTFEPVNKGVLEHDFTIGDAATQGAHESEMAEAVSMEEGEGHGADSNALTVPGGETAELTWQFTDPGEEILFGCHIPGHYDAGMVGEFTLI